MTKNKCLILFLSLIVLGCSGAKSKPDSEQITLQGDSSRDPSSIKNFVPVNPLESPSEIDKILEETNPVLAENPDGEKVPLHIPVEINRKVAEWIRFFTEREREMTQRYFERGEALRPHIQAMLKENEVPQELYYLAMIESGFVTHAKSRAKAVGIWQFMPGTGKNYGLAVNKNIDERRNWIKATEAAASYLKDLNNVFGSWYLALASYNAGEYRIVRSIMKGKTRDFWALAEAGLLPQETLNYVPKFLAAQIVGKNMKRFGFEVTVDPEDRWEDYETVNVPSGIRLKEISKISGVPHDVLKRWNFDLIRDITPKSKNGSAEIYVPKNMVAKIDNVKDELAKLKPVKGFKEDRSYASAESGDDTYKVHVVRKNESLYSIAKKLGVSVRTLMKVNGIKKSKIHPGMRLKAHTSVVNNDDEEGDRGVASTKKKKSKKKRKNNS